MFTANLIIELQLPKVLTTWYGGCSPQQGLATSAGTTSFTGNFQG
jgi:hypothetical protein